MAFKDDPKFVAFWRQGSVLKAFIVHLLENNDSDVYERTNEWLKLLISQGRINKEAVLLARDIGRARIIGVEAEVGRKALAVLLLSLRKPGELKHICDQSPTGFGQPVSTVITNFCKFCSKQVEE